MYKIVLKNVGKDMVNGVRTSPSNNIDDAVLTAHTMCRDILGQDKFFIFKVVGEEINITIDNLTVGSLTITKLH